MTPRSAAAAKPVVNIHEYVGKQIRELRGTRHPSDFAKMCGLNPALLPKLEGGTPTCLARLQIIAEKNDVEVEYFFPDATIPDDYLDH